MVNQPPYSLTLINCYAALAKSLWTVLTCYLLVYGLLFCLNLNRLMAFKRRLRDQVDSC